MATGLSSVALTFATKSYQTESAILIWYNQSMKAVMLYHPGQEYSRQVEEYINDFTRSRGRTIEPINIDTKDGAETARQYDVVQYPCLMVLREDGQLMNMWQGIDSFPLMNELDSYLLA